MAIYTLLHNFKYDKEELFDLNLLILNFIKFSLKEYIEVIEEIEGLQSYPAVFDSYEEWMEYLKNLLKVLEEIINEEMENKDKLLEFWHKFVKIFDYLWV